MRWRRNQAYTTKKNKAQEFRRTKLRRWKNITTQAVEKKAAQSVKEQVFVQVKKNKAQAAGEEENSGGG